MKPGRAVLLAAVLAAGSALLLYGAPRRVPARSEVRAGPKDRPGFLASGLVYQASLAGQRTASIAVDRATMQNRRIGGFSIRPLKEVTLSGVRARFAAEPSESGEQGARPTVPAELGDHARYLITKLARDRYVARIRGETLEVALTDEDGEAITLRAARFALLPDEGSLELGGGVRIRARDGSRIDAAGGVWDGSRSTFLVRGVHDFTDGAGTRAVGRDGEFELDPSGTISEGPA